MPESHTSTRTVTSAVRRRGSAYILVLGASLLVATIGISALMANRVRSQAAGDAADLIEARELARTALDRGLWEVQNNPAGWRVVFDAGTLNDVGFGGGTFTAAATDPDDNNLLDNNADPVFLYGVGKAGSAKYVLAVMLNGDGTIQPGTWRRVVN